VKLEFHPVAEIFPLMADAELEALAADIKESGLREPVWLHSDGRLIDGRNRYLACQKAGVAPTTREWGGDESQLLSFVVSLNLHRRHLSESQRAAIGERLAQLPKGHRVDYANKIADTEISVSALTQSQAAKLLNVSTDLVQAARVVRQRGTKEEMRAVEQGTAKVTTVARMIRAGKPAEERKAVLYGFTDKLGRRMPERPLGECMERGLDQIDNTIETLTALFDRAAGREELSAWLSRLEKSRASISRLINANRERNVA